LVNYNLLIKSRREADNLDDRLFGLDIQLLFDAAVNVTFILILFFIMSRLFFKPVREFIEKRKAAIDEDIKMAGVQNSQSEQLKAEYETMLQEVHKEAESLMSLSRKEALKRQEEIIAQAKQEADAIIEQANQEARLEKSRIKDDVKQEMASVASMLANQFVVSKDPFREALLLEETLKEMGDEAWQN